MPAETQSESTALPPARGDARDRAAPRFQFSVSALLLAMLVVGIGCAALRWAAAPWTVPLGLAGLSVASVVLGVRRRSNGRMLKLGPWQFAVWFALAAVASGLAVRGCLDYNTIAGTDKTPGHIVQISAAMLAGPLVGPIANSGAGERDLARRWAGSLFTILFLATSPFLFVRRVVPLAVALMCWTLFIAASVLWFFGALVSLAVFLS